MNLTVTPADTARHLERLADERRRRGHARAHNFRAHLPAAAALLKDRFGVQRVLSFGSLRTGTFNEGSDLDRAVEDLATADYSAALADLM